MTKTNFQFSFGGNKPKTAMGEIDIVFVYRGYKLPMKVLVVTDEVPFLIGMETIRELTHGVMWEQYPVKRQWLEMRDGVQLDLVESSDNGHIGFPWSGATIATRGTPQNIGKRTNVTIPSQCTPQHVTTNPMSQKSSIFLKLTNLLYILVASVIKGQEVLNKLFLSVKCIYEPEDLELIDAKLNKLNFILKTAQTDPVYGFSDEIFWAKGHHRVKTSYEFLNLLECYNIISYADRTKYYVPVYEEIKHFENVKRKLLRKMKGNPNKIYITKGKTIKKSKIKKSVLNKKDKYDEPEKFIEKHLYDQGFKKLDLENRGISSSEMSSLSDESDADEFSVLQKVKNKEIKNRQTKRKIRKRKEYKNTEQRLSNRLRKDDDKPTGETILQCAPKLDQTTPQTENTETQDEEYDQFIERPIDTNIATKMNITRFTDLMEQEIDDLINEGFSDEEIEESGYIVKNHVWGEINKIQCNKSKRRRP